MTLKHLAESYTNQYLSWVYNIQLTDYSFKIIGYPHNFAHLTGLQKSHNLNKISNWEKFYFDCMQDAYLDDISTFAYSKSYDSGCAKLKTSYFYKMESAILNAKVLYHLENDIVAISSLFRYGKDNSKYKYCTILFSPNKDKDVYYPISLQIDRKLQSGVLSDTKSSETILNVKRFSRTPPYNDKCEINIQELITV